MSTPDKPDSEHPEAAAASHDLTSTLTPTQESANTISPEDSTPATAEAPASRTARIWQGLSLALTLLVLWKFIPVREVLRDTTITGGDIAGHVWFPYEMKNLLPHLSGWSDDWYAGFPER